MATRGTINEIRDKFDLQSIAYDGTYATALMQQLREEDGMNINEQFIFKQSMMEFTAGTVAYENLLIENRLHHNGNALLTWQAGNVRVKSDYNQNIRPIKQQHGDYRTIDGIVAGVMALTNAIKGEEKKRSVYETRGVLSLGDGDLGAHSTITLPTTRAHNWQEI